MSYTNLWRKAAAIARLKLASDVLTFLKKREHLLVIEWWMDERRTMKTLDGRDLCSLPPETKIVMVATSYSVLIRVGYTTVTCPNCIGIIQGSKDLRDKYWISR
jgi:hypothetical protein